MWFCISYSSVLFYCDLKQSTENTTTNQSVEITEDFHDVTLKRDKNPSVVKYREKCTIPCELAAKLMKEERHSLCSMYVTAWMISEEGITYINTVNIKYCVPHSIQKYHSSVVIICDIPVLQKCDLRCNVFYERFRWPSAFNCFIHKEH